jgi:L-threonylcarbamoyladenylate synthase
VQIFDSLQNIQLIKAIQGGAVGVIPTDTVYGLVCAASNEDAVTRLYGLKAREQKPGTIIAANVQQIIDIGILPTYLDKADKFWPGPVSVETPHGISYLSQNTGRQAIRIPGDATLIAFLEKTGPLQTTSANEPGEPPANTVDEAKAYFGDQVDFYVDGGDTTGSAPSTIIRFDEKGDIEVIRQGAGKISK